MILAHFLFIYGCILPTGSGLTHIHCFNYHHDSQFSQFIRDSGASNMFDLHTVQRLAYEQEMYELVTYIEEHPRAYFHFIMYGTEE